MRSSSRPLPIDGFLVEDVLDLYHGRGAFEAVLADEDVEEDPDRWCSYTECGQELWQIACQWVWNLLLALGREMQTDTIREIEWAAAKEVPSHCVASPFPCKKMACSVAQREQTSGSVKCVKKMPLRNGPSTSPPRRIVRIVNCGDNAWDEARKAIVLVGSVPCAVSCPVLHLCSQILIFSEPSGGWM